MIHTCSPSTWEAKTGELQVGEQFELQSKALSQISKNQPNKEKNIIQALYFFKMSTFWVCTFWKNLDKWMVLKHAFQTDGKVMGLKYKVHIIAEEIILPETEIS